MKLSRVSACSLLAAVLGLGVAGNGSLPFATTARAEAPARTYTVSKVRGGLVVSRGRAKVCRIRTDLPFVEEWKFIGGEAQIAVKSRGRHGPASVELFDTATGAPRGKIQAYAIKGGKPPWAAGFEE